ncbi:MAG: GNAT family N-acetyltransferase [Candidatus Tectomicrobia bacterium]|nr:GNAT family N-acetyltransferase [Candidatus Tectomicrobia bacterium]
MATITAPQPLNPDHDISQFDSGVSDLDDWLRDVARFNEVTGGSRTYVICDGNRVIGFYSLAAGSVERERLPSRVMRSMPEPVPVVLLGQLGVDLNYRSLGFGHHLMIDAARRVLETARQVGVRAVIVQALDERAMRFYTRFGFRQFSNQEPLMLVLPVKKLQAIFNEQ